MVFVVSTKKCVCNVFYRECNGLYLVGLILECGRHLGVSEAAGSTASSETRGIGQDLEARAHDASSYSASTVAPRSELDSYISCEVS